MIRLALIEDDDSIRDALTLGMVNRGYSVHTYGTAESALESVHPDNTDVALVDVMLPGMNGIQLCRTLRSHFPGLSLVILTARDGDADMVQAFDAGADDYIVKPAEPGVIDARMRAVLRRTAPQSTPAAPTQPAQEENGLVVDPAAVTVSRDGTEIALTATEMRLFLHLHHNRGVVLSRQQLLEQVWGYSFAGDERLVDTTIQRLRAKVETDRSNPQLIRTVRGFGYRFSS